MSELTFEQMLEESLKTIHTGEVVEGTVIDVKPEEAILNIGYKSDGVLTRNEYTNEPNVDLTKVIKVGDTMEVKVLKVNDGEGQVTLTYKRLAADRGNKRIEEAFNNKEVLKAKVSQVLDGGLSVIVDEVRIFIPASLVSDSYEKDLSKYAGQEIEFVISEYNPKRRRYIGDRRQLLVAEKQEKQQRKAEDNKRRHTDIKWDRLDNTAHLFPVIAGESMSNVYRIAVTLKEEVQPEYLQQALDIVLPKFPGFNLRLRQGIFWYYFEENGKSAPRVQEERHFPCRFIRQNKNHSYLFRVTYYKCRINLEVFHVLTDGMGGINFLKELTYQYLRLVHPELKEKLGDKLSSDTSMNREDSFLKNYKHSYAKGYKTKKAYLIKGEKLRTDEFGVIHGFVKIPALKEVCHKYGVSINEYLVAAFAYSVYREYLHGMPDKRPIRVAVPVNLRPYFNSITTKNFFTVVSAEFEPVEDSYTFEEVLKITTESLHQQINKEHLEELFSYNVSNEKLLVARAVPLFLKNIAMRYVYTSAALANTSTVTNIGNVKVEEDYQPYIKMFYAFLAMSKGQNIKGTICSYQDTLAFTFSSVLKDTSLQRGFFRKLSEDGLNVEIESNGVYYE